MGPGDVPQAAAVEPHAAAKGQVVIQRAAIVPQGGRAEQDEQVVELGLGAGVGVQLGGAVGVQHAVGAAFGAVSKGCGALGAEVHLHGGGVLDRKSVV